MTGGGGTTPGFVAGERGGHPERHFGFAVSVGAMALAWARQEGAPQGATVVADHEVTALGRLRDPWPAPAADTLAAAIVVRPDLPVALADAAWLLAGLAAAEGTEAVSGRPAGVWWPESVVDRDSEATLGQTKADIQLGPAQVRSAVLTIRLDLRGAGLEASRRGDLLDAVLGAFDRLAGRLGDGAEGCAELAAAYDRRCPLLGRPVKVTLLPKGETRGVASRVDQAARLELVSPTGMTERIGVDNLRRLEVAGGPPGGSPGGPPGR